MPDLAYMHPDGSPSPFDHLLPSVELQVDERHLDQFFKVMIERQNIYWKKEVEKLPWPWTNDPIFQEFKFTNVYRELDKNSQWEIQNIILREDLTDESRLFQILIFRAFNQPLFFEFVKRNYPGGMPSYEGYDSGLFAKLIEDYRATGNNPFTNSYVTNSKLCPGKSRDWCFGNSIIPEYHKQIPEILTFIKESNSGYDVACRLKDLPSTGWFLAHEYYISLCYIKRYLGKSFFKFTEDDWTNVGPGASLGLRLIFPSLKNRKQQHSGIYRLRDISDSKLKEVGDFIYLDACNKRLNLHNVEFMLCEYSKYWRMTVGEGKTRQKYKGIVRQL